MHMITNVGSHVDVRIGAQTASFVCSAVPSLQAETMPKKYVLVEWESDSSVSVVPTSRLKTRSGDHCTQSWPSGVFAGTILDESGK